ncbi:MAG: DUF362 domain-containing protein [Candidatus Latescibacterota bacterium]
MSRSQIILRSVEDSSVEEVIREIFERFDYHNLIPDNSRVVIKVNLSTPFAENAKASNTSVEILEQVCKLVKGRTKNVVVGESNGMRYDTEQAFEVSKYYPVLDKYDVKMVNFTKDEWLETDEPLLKGWGLPKTLLAADVLITLPVLKTHATTVFTGALKNQFGCVPRHDRILLHPHLDQVLVALNRILRPKLTIMDGIIGMEGRGPINGRPREFGKIIASTDPVAVDATAMRLVGIDPMTSKHVRLAAAEGLGNIDESSIDIDGDFERYKITFDPAEKDLPIKVLGWISHSKFLTNKLILNPESFYPLRSVAMIFREVRDFILTRTGLKKRSPVD